MDVVERNLQEGNGASGRFRRPHLGTTIPEMGLFGNKRSLRRTRLFSGGVIEKIVDYLADLYRISLKWGAESKRTTS